MSNEQIKLISSYFKELGYAQFAFFGVTGYSSGNWLVVSISSIIFVVMAVISVVVMGFQRGDSK